MTCSRCHAPLKPLFTGFFCPNDCDKKADPSGAKRYFGYTGTSTAPTEYSSRGSKFFFWESIDDVREHIKKDGKLAGKFLMIFEAVKYDGVGIDSRNISPWCGYVRDYREIERIQG